MLANHPAIAQIVNQRVLPLYFHADKEVTVKIARALHQAGGLAIEYTNRGPAALENFKALKSLKDNELPDLVLGAGTIKNEAEAEAFIEAGAEFIISPFVNARIAPVAQAAGLPWLPGCMTPTEIHTAVELGVGLVKLFPGNVLGPGFISAVAELFPGMKFMPTGGVEATSENLGAWFKAGAVAVGMGSKLISPKLIADGKFDALLAEAKQAIDLAQQISKR